jgi:hypothetical protein
MNLDEQIRANLERYQERKGQIRAAKIPLPGADIEVDLPHSEKLRHISEVYREHRKRYEELAAKKRQQVIDDHAASAQEFFRPRLPGSDPAHVMASMRDALERVDGIQDARTLKERLDRAHYTGDAVLAKAVAIRACELGELAAGDVLPHYLKLYPGERARYEGYVRAGQELQQVEEFGVPGTPDEPPELNNAEGRATLRAVEREAEGAA